MANEVFARRLKELRKEKNMTQKDLANELGISMGSIGFYENQERTPDIDFLVKVSDYFEVSTEYLLGKSDSVSNDPNIRLFLEKTGLSDTAVSNFIEFKDKKIYHKKSTFNHDPWGNAFVNYDKDELTSFSSNLILNSIFESHSFFELVLQIGQFMCLSNERKYYNNYLLDLIVKKNKVPSKEMVDVMELGDEYCDLSMFRCEKEFRNLIEDLQIELDVESICAIDTLRLADGINEMVSRLDIKKPCSGTEFRDAYDKIINRNLNLSKAGDPDGMDKKEE